MNISTPSSTSTPANNNNTHHYTIEASCAICRDVYEDANTCIVLPCKHYFHDECAVHWLNVSIFSIYVIIIILYYYLYIIIES